MKISKHWHRFCDSVVAQRDCDIPTLEILEILKTHLDMTPDSWLWLALLKQRGFEKTVSKGASGFGHAVALCFHSTSKKTFSIVRPDLISWKSKVAIKRSGVNHFKYNLLKQHSCAVL